MDPAFLSDLQGFFSLVSLVSGSDFSVLKTEFDFFQATLEPSSDPQALHPRNIQAAGTAEVSLTQSEASAAPANQEDFDEDWYLARRLVAEMSQVAVLSPTCYQKIRNSAFPSTLKFLLVAKGEYLYLFWKPTMKPKWDLFQECVGGEADWSTALEAALWFALGCLTRNLATLPDTEFRTYLRASEEFWEGFGQCSFQMLAKSANSIKQCLRSLILIVLLERSRVTNLSEVFLTSAGVWLSGFAALKMKKIQRKTFVTSLSEDTCTLVENILKKDYVETIYLRLLQRVYPAESKGELRALYTEAVTAFRSCLFSMEKLAATWMLYGVTIPGPIVLIDRLHHRHSDLVQGYEVRIALHEFAHFVSRHRLVHWKDFHNTATPPIPKGKKVSEEQPEVSAFTCEREGKHNRSMSQPADSQPVREQGKTSRKARESKKKPQADTLEKKQKTMDSGEMGQEQMRQDSAQLEEAFQDSAEDILPIVRTITEDFPERANGEAGKQVEKALFGKLVPYLRLSAASWLIRWANTEGMKQSTFTAKFWALNKASYVESSNCVSCGLSSYSCRCEAADFVEFKGCCGHDHR